MVRMEIRSVLSIIVSLAMTSRLVSCQCSDKDLTAVETLTVTEYRQEYITPNYPLFYYARMNCQWVFDAGKVGGYIIMDVVDMQFELSANCLYDSFTIYAGQTSNSPIVKTLCGVIPDGQLVTVPGQYGMVKVKTDRSRQSPGAKMFYLYGQDHSGGVCSTSPAALTASSTENLLTSPGFPTTSLTANQNCQWLITSATGSTVHIQFIYVDLDGTGGVCGTQTLSVYDGSSTADLKLVDYCDDRLSFPSKATEYISTGNNVLVSLVTSSATSSHIGFKLEYKQEGDGYTIPPTTPAPTTVQQTAVCSSSPTALTVTETWQTFTSAGYPQDYSNLMNCYWLLEAAVGSNINLTIADSLLQRGTCSTGDVVFVYDGSSASHVLLTSFCGEDHPVVISTGRFMYVHFRTDASITFRGFSANYKSITAEVPVCSSYTLEGDFTANFTQQELMSTGYPTSNYDHDVTMYWRIYNPNGTHVIYLVVDPSSRIEGSVNCQYDSVKIYQGPCDTYPLLGQFCGKDEPVYQYSGTYALIVFTTDATVTYKGFKITFYLGDPTTQEDTVSVKVVLIVVLVVVLTVVAIAAAIAIAVKLLRPSTPAADTERMVPEKKSGDVVTSQPPVATSSKAPLPPIKGKSVHVM